MCWCMSVYPRAKISCNVSHAPSCIVLRNCWTFPNPVCSSAVYCAMNGTYGHMDCQLSSASHTVHRNKIRRRWVNLIMHVANGAVRFDILLPSIHDDEIKGPEPRDDILYGCYKPIWAELLGYSHSVDAFPIEGESFTRFFGCYKLSILVLAQTPYLSFELLTST